MHHESWYMRKCAGCFAACWAMHLGELFPIKVFSLVFPFFFPFFLFGRSLRLLSHLEKRHSHNLYSCLMQHKRTSIFSFTENYIKAHSSVSPNDLKVTKRDGKGWKFCHIALMRPLLHFIPAAEWEENGLNLSAAHIWESFETFHKAYHMFSDGLNPAKGSPVRGLRKKIIFFFSPGGEKMRKRKLNCIMGFLSCRWD